MSIPAGNGAPGVSGTGPALGYTLNLFWFNILFMLISENNMNTSTYFVHTLSLLYAMKLLLIFEIKIYRKLPSLTCGSHRTRSEHANVQKRNINQSNNRMNCDRDAKSQMNE